MTLSARSITQKAAAVFCALLIPVTVGFGQVPPPGDPQVQGQPAAPSLTPEQLDNLVAPVALYPDPLLGQVLAASTYPLETVEAAQWLKQQSNLRGNQLVDSAKRMNWDPSVQALVAFPDALNLLANDVGWTTDLGNAYLAQQGDVMNAVQRMRARARANGKLESTPQEVVTTDTQDGQSAIEIQPSNPDVIYVPVYEPQYVWGPPEWGAYPDLWYPPDYGYGFGFGWGPGIYISSYFPGWGGWGGWGWGCGWFGGIGGRGLFVNTAFFNHYGFRGDFGRGFGERNRFGAGRASWAHDPGHRGTVPYPNRSVATRFNSTRFNGPGGNASRGRFNGGNRAAEGRQFSGGRTNGPIGAGQSNRGANTNQFRTFNGDNRSNGNNRPTGNGFAGSGRQAGPANNGAGLTQTNRGAANAGAGGWRTFNGNNRAVSNGNNRPTSNGFAGSMRQASPSPNVNAAPRNNSASSFRSAPSGRSYAPQYSAPRSQSFSAPRSYSAPSAPRQSFSAPRSQSFSAPRSAPASRGFSGGGGGGAPRSFGGGGGGSRPSGGFSGGGHSGGGGGGGGRHR